MKNTTNYNLKLPEGPDKYNISDFNENTEKIDGELKKHADYIADRYNKTEIDNKFSMHEMNVDWKESVDTFNDIVVAYPAPESGWTVNVKDTNYTYRYDGTDWIAISSNAIPKATQAVDGLMSKEQAAVLNKLDQAVGSLQNLTTSEKQSLVGAVNEVKSEVIQLNADLDNIQVGGRNLLKAQCICGKGTVKNGDYSVKTTGENVDTFFYCETHMPLEIDQEYTFSYMVDYDGDLSSSTWKFGIDGSRSSTVPITKGWHSVTLKFTETPKSKFIIDDFGERDTNGVVVTLNKLKLVKGNKSTDWTPAPEDTEAQIDQINADLDSTASSLNTRFECGKVVIAGKSGEWSFVHVAYSHPHNNNPVVVASHASANVAQCACSIRLHNESGFDIGVYNTTAQTTFNWIAIEP